PGDGRPKSGEWTVALPTSHLPPILGPMRSLRVPLTVVALLVALPATASAATCAGHHVTIRGTAGNDVIRGHQRPDVTEARPANDTILSKGGNDIVCGGEGDDRIVGGDGSDRLFGEAGND